MDGDNDADDGANAKGQICKLCNESFNLSSASMEAVPKSLYTKEP